MKGIKEIYKEIVTPVELTKEEIIERLNLIKQIRNDIVGVLYDIKELKTQLKQKQSTLNSLLEEVCSCKAQKNITAKIIIDFDKGIKTIIDTETGIVVAEKEIEPQDLQEELLLNEM